ncbi:MAG: CDP-glycerol glycerophosphotransferase family protein [Treponema sp.]|nr:CDP-glycerol glycerophosphotransferase family protein [Treponema sp.]
MILSPLYIDPGTGSMLFSIIIGLATTAVFGFRALLIKLKSVLGRGKQERLDKSHRGIVIYTDSKRYWNVFCPICHEFERREIPLTYYTQSADDPALAEDFKYVHAEFIGEGNKGIARMNFLNADICLSTTPDLDVLQWKRSRYVKCYVHIPHTADELLGYHLFGLDFYDAVLLTGKFQEQYIRSLEKMRGTAEKELSVVGCTYLDVMKSRLLACRPPAELSNGSVTVLLAPSWGKDAILSKYGERIIEALLATGFTIIIRPHPQSLSSEKNIIEPLQKKYLDSENLHWNYDNDNFNVLNTCSIMITDFSGIILDYALVFGKPLIYADTVLDLSPYDACWFDEPVWRLKILPEIGLKLNEADFPRMKQIIERSLSDETFKKNRERISDEAWQNKGKAAEVVVDYLIGKSAKIVAADSIGNSRLDA